MDPVPNSFRGPGLRVRFSRIHGVTPKGVLETPLYLPVVLNDFTVPEEADHREYTTVAAGDFSVPAPGPSTARTLRDLSLETLTIDWHAYARWLTFPQTRPERVKEELKRILRARRPFNVVAVLADASGKREEARMKATLRSVGRTLRAREADTRYYTLELKEWRDNRVTRRQEGKSVNPREHLPTTARLTADTTLNSLSRYYFGSTGYSRDIARANGIKSWGASTPLVQTKRFKVGDKVKIPEVHDVISDGGSPPVGSLYGVTITGVG